MSKESYHFTRLQDLISSLLGISRDNISTETTLMDLGADSMDLAELAMLVEEEFEIDLPNTKEIELCKSTAKVQDWLDYLEATV